MPGQVRISITSWDLWWRFDGWFSVNFTAMGVKLCQLFKWLLLPLKSSLCLAVNQRPKMPPRKPKKYCPFHLGFCTWRPGSPILLLQREWGKQSVARRSVTKKLGRIASTAVILYFSADNFRCRFRWYRNDGSSDPARLWSSWHHQRPATILQNSDLRSQWLKSAHTA